MFRQQVERAQCWQFEREWLNFVSFSCLGSPSEREIATADLLTRREGRGKGRDSSTRDGRVGHQRSVGLAFLRVDKTA